MVEPVAQPPERVPGHLVGDLGVDLHRERDPAVPELARQLDELITTKRNAAHLVTMEEVDGRSLPGKLRDGVARLLTPYL